MTGGPHRHFHDALARLKQRVLDMSSITEDAVAKAVDSFLARDADAARSVSRGDSTIDSLEVEINDTVTQLLALHQPVATDLRLILAALKISNDLERVGDHAVNIAQSARRLAASSIVDIDPELIEMSREVRSMLANALSAFVKADAQAGRSVCRQDDHVDALHKSNVRRLGERMENNPASVGEAMDILRVSRNLERVADLATNIAEDVVFYVEGTDIKHHQESAAQTPHVGA